MGWFVSRTDPLLSSIFLLPPTKGTSYISTAPCRKAELNQSPRGQFFAYGVKQLRLTQDGEKNRITTPDEN